MNPSPILEAPDEEDLFVAEPLTSDESPAPLGPPALPEAANRHSGSAGLRTDSLAASVVILVVLSIGQRLIVFETPDCASARVSAVSRRLRPST